MALAACSGSSDDAGEPLPSNDSSVSDDIVGSDDEAGTDDAEIGDESGGEDGTPPTSTIFAGVLGFDREHFDVPVPDEPDELHGTFADAGEVIDAGVDAGVWTEAEGVRAILSVVMGELPASAIPALNTMQRNLYGDAVERAADLLESHSLTADVEADLSRLTQFFVADELPETGSSLRNAPVGLRSVATTTTDCGINEANEFSAAPALLCYQTHTNGDDQVLIPIHDDAVDIADHVFELIHRARSGYEGYTGFKLQPIRLLVSIDAAPPDADVPTGTVLAHVASAHSGRCRIAIFSTETLATGTPHLDHTIAHELFHCIQDFWPDFPESSKFTSEGGADYFAYQLLGLCTAEQIELGANLDTHTAENSMLDATYHSWFFWAYLAEQGHLTPQQIASVHENIAGGATVTDALKAAVSDLPAVINEFYARMVGPGLACGFQGSAFTGTPITVDQKGPVQLRPGLWQGTRYKLEYAKGKLYKQTDDGSGPIGMVDFEKRGDRGSWVVTEPEVRTKCQESETWIAVVTTPEVSPSSDLPHALEVDRADPGGCDPCVVGTWSIDLATFSDYFETLSAGQEIEIAGTYTLNFGPGPPEGNLQFSDQRDIAISFPGADASGLAVRLAGGGSATYQASSTHMSTSGYADSGTASILGGPVTASSPFSNTGDGGVEYTCDDDLLIAQIDGTPVYANRTPTTPKGTPYFR